MKEKIIQIMSEICPGVDFATETALIDDGLVDSRKHNQTSQSSNKRSFYPYRRFCWAKKKQRTWTC